MASSDYDFDNIIKLVNEGDVKSLIRMVEHSNNPLIVKKAIEWLGVLEAGEAVDSLIIKALQSKLITVRLASIRALGYIGGEKAIKPLAAMVDDMNEERQIREESLTALGEIGKKGSDLAINIIVHESYGELGDQALTVLQNVGQAALKPLVDILNGTDQRIKEKAVIVLGEISAKLSEDQLQEYLQNINVVETLIHIIDADEAYAIKCSAVIVLGYIGDSRAFEILLILLEDEKQSDRIRGLAAWALGKLRDERAVKPLSRILENPKSEDFTLQNAIWSLLQFDDSVAAVPIFNYYRKNLELLKYFGQ
jgi:HEAT repeat protein